MNCLKCHLQIDHPRSAHYGLHPDCFTQWFKAPETAEFVSLQRRSSTSLSPIYDNVSYLSLESGNMLKADFNPTGKISTSATLEPGMRDYVIELKKLGFRDDIQEFYKSVKLPQIYQLIDESFCSTLMKEAIKTLIKKRFSELENELSN
jgi:hypothetical protein